MRQLLASLTIASLGTYVLFGALALEWYPLVLVALACFAVGGLPALKLRKRH